MALAGTIPVIEPTHSLFDALNEFQLGRSHLALVRERLPVFAPLAAGDETPFDGAIAYMGSVSCECMDC